MSHEMRLALSVPLAFVVSLLLVASCTWSESETASVLGLEPGTTRLCNDDIGVILWGPDAAPTLSVGKSDVWDRRNPPLPQPVLTLAQIMEMAKDGDPAILDGAAYYSVYNAYDFPCPKPVGQLILQLDFIEPGGTLTVEREPRQVRLHAVKGDKTLDLQVFVSAVRNVIVIRGEGSGLTEGDLGLRLYRHRDTIVPGGELHPTIGGGVSPNDFEPLSMPRAGHSDGVCWVAQDFPADPTFPAGFTAALVARLADTPVTVDVAEGVTGLGTPMIAEKEGRISHGLTKRYTPINQSPGSGVTARPVRLDGPFEWVATVATSQDDPDPLAKARQNLDEAVAIGAAALWDEHVAQLDAYETRPHARAWSGDGATRLDVLWGGIPYRVRPAGYYGDVPLCSVDSTKFCFQDSSMWHADFHFNEIDATGHCIQRQFDALDSYFRMILTMLPMAQANAREVYACSGAMYPLVHYPLKADRVIHTHLTWEQSMEITALLTRPFWQRFLYTWDRTFLRDLAYPVLREGARFYADFLKQNGDGLYHVFPTVSPEHRGITKNLEFNKDSQSAITLIRYNLRAAAKAAALLGVDDAEAARWREIAAHMPDYPTVDTPEGPIYIDVAGAKPIEYNIPVPLSAVFWGDDIGLDSSPEQLELARRTLRLINVWEPHRGYLRRVRARLGICEPSDSLGLENFLQSYTGVVRVFPAVADDFEGGFENLDAEGAFVVSAERTKDGVASVTLTSLAGNPCALANPWPTKPVRVVDLTTNTEKAIDTGTRTVSFATDSGHTYRVTTIPDAPVSLPENLQPSSKGSVSLQFPQPTSP